MAFAPKRFSFQKDNCVKTKSIVICRQYLRKGTEQPGGKIRAICTCRGCTHKRKTNSTAAQLLSREPRVFISRPNVRGTLVAVEKAASHSVSLFTIYHYYVGSQISIQARLVELLDSEQLSFHFASSMTISTSNSILIYAQVWPSPPPGFVVRIFAVVGTLPAQGAVACELLTLPIETSVVH